MKQIHKFRLGTFLACALIMCACASSVLDIHNSRINVDWAGTYTGVIPSADGSRIAAWLTLNRDESYELVHHYVGRNAPEYIYTGKFKWNKGGDNIILDSGPKPRKYKVGKNKLWKLDRRGKRITGDLAQMYIFQKEQ